MKKGFILTIVLVLAAGCSQMGAKSKVTGTITYLQRIALPPDAVVTVRIEDVSKMDVAAEVINEISFETDGQQVPLPFEIAYDPADIKESNRYNLLVRIEDSGGRLLFITDTIIPIITMDSPVDNIEVVVVQVSSN